MHNIKVAKRYAKSLIDLAKETGVLDAVSADMKLLVSVCQSSKELTSLLGNPIINSDKKEAVLNAIFGDKIQPMTRSFFQILIRKGREGDLRQNHDPDLDWSIQQLAAKMKPKPKRKPSRATP